ncbi:hypothetical protein [Capnocytophaga granulosa]
MRKILFFVVLFFSAFSYGQLKQTKLTDEEVSMLGVRIHSFRGRGSLFNYEDLKNYHLLDLLGFIVEYQYKGKSIAKVFVRGDYTMGSGETLLELSFLKLVNVCFRTSDLPNDLMLTLLRENAWEVDKGGGNEEFICYIGSMNIFYLDEKGYYRLKTLADEQIKIVLYKVELF